MVSGDGSAHGEDPGTGQASWKPTVPTGPAAKAGPAAGASRPERSAESADSESAAAERPHLPRPPAPPIPNGASPHQQGQPDQQGQQSGQWPGYPSRADGPHAPHGYPPPRRRRRLWPYVVAWLILSPLLFIGCAVILLNRAADSVKPDEPRQQAQETDARTDATVTECAPDSRGRLHALVVVRNSTSTERTYSVEVTFVAVDGTRLGESFALVSSLPAGASSQPVEASDPELAPAEGYTCPLGAVTRI